MSYINESNTNNTIPTQYTFNFTGGSYYFVITVRDKSLFSNVGNLKSNMMKSCEEMCQNKNLSKEDTAKHLKNVSNNIFVSSNNKRLDKNTEAVFINIKINPERLINSDTKEIDINSVDYKRVIRILNTLSKPPYSVPFSENEVEYVLNYFKNNILNITNDIDSEGLDRETNDLFFELCKRINEEEVRRWLSNIKIEGDEYAIDYQGSLKNRLKMLAQALKYGDVPTYLATEKQWWDKGRRVVNFDMPYYGVTANAGRNKLSKEIDAAAAQGYKPVYDENGNITQASRRTITNLTNVGLMGNRKLTFSYNAPYYDVKATEPVSGLRDQFSDLPSFSNNFDATLNDPALDLMSNVPDKSQVGNERADALNQAFGITDNKDIDAKYLAICKVAKMPPSLTKEDSEDDKVRECSKMIALILKNKLSKFDENGGRLIRGVNRNKIIDIGTVLLMASIKLPMNNAPRVSPATEEERDIINALSVPVYQISGSINATIRKIKSQQSNLSINEVLEIYNSHIIYEEWFNKTLSILLENEKR